MRALALILCLLALGLTACGGEDSGKGLPSSTARALLKDLTAVQNRLDQGSVGACEEIPSISVRDLQRKIESLPANVDASLRQALTDSVENLKTVAQEECDKRRAKAEKKKKTNTETVPTPVTPTPTPTPTQTQTTPAPTTTETTPKPDKTPEKKKSSGGDKSGSGDQSGATAPSDQGTQGGAGGGTSAP